MSRTVLITSSEPRASQLAQKIETIGFTTIVSPLLEIIDCIPDTISVSGLQGVVITSHHALKAAKKFRHMPLIVVGKATAQTALAEGLGVLFYAPDVTSLCAQIREDLNADDGGLLYLAGDEVSANLSKLLPNFNTTKIVVYQAREQGLSSDAIKALQKNEVAFTSLLSSRTAEIMRNQVRDHKITKALHSCIAICFSEQIAKTAQLLPWQHVLITPQPDEGSLLEILRMFSAKPA